MITVRAYANADDVLIAWKPDEFSDAWVGFQIERRDEHTQKVTVLVNRIPPQPGSGPAPPAGIPSDQSPIRRCLWTDHSVVATDQVSYRVTAMTDAPGGKFAADPLSTSAWTQPVLATGDAGGGLQAFFNRGTLMSQIVTRFVNGDTSDDSLRAFLENLQTPGFPARRYLSGDALPAILKFLRDADRRGGTIHAAIYEMNDHELVDALKPFGARGHVLLGNGEATEDWVAQELEAAGLEVRHRDLSHAGRSSPSVHNKFVVESDGQGHASRALTGSTNWTFTGLCTQLNNVLIVDSLKIAQRFLKQWDDLVAAGDDMTAGLRKNNSKATSDGNIELYFAATTGQAEFKPIEALIDGATQGALFLMFMPGNSPLLQHLLDRAQENEIYVRGVVSTVNRPAHPQPGDITQVGGQVIRSGQPPKSFHNDVRLPSGISDRDKPSFEEREFNVQEMRAHHLMAIVHSKAIVIDPFSPNCAVITGSHNFSPNATANNDENLVIIRGNQALAQAYALHMTGVYDHYSWRAFLGSGGDPNLVFKPLDAWKPGGSRAAELDFWMTAPGGPAVPPAPVPKPKKPAKPKTKAAKAKKAKKPAKRAAKPKARRKGWR